MPSVTRCTILDGNHDKCVAKAELAVAQALAHELGHAAYVPPPAIPPNGLTKQEYVDANVMQNLRDEAEATFANLKARDEIKAKSGNDIGVAGVQSAQYIAIYEAYKLDPTDANRQAAIDQIATQFGSGEQPSVKVPNPTTGVLEPITDPATGLPVNYTQYYAKQYQDAWDATYPTLKPEDRAPP